MNRKERRCRKGGEEGERRERKTGEKGESVVYHIQWFAQKSVEEEDMAEEERARN